MHLRLSPFVAMASLCALAAGVAPGRPGDAATKSSFPAPPALPQAREAVARGLGFLEKDAAKWRKEHECASCHQGTMTVWALTEAKSRGYAVAADTLAEMTKWTKDRILPRMDAPRDPRPGWNMVSTPALYLALMARTVPGQEAVTPDELHRIAGHLMRHQEADGSWAWSLAPAQNRPPPVMESDEVVTLMASLALGRPLPADREEAAGAGESRAKAAAWLRNAAPGDGTQAAALRLLAHAWERQPPKALRAEIAHFLGRQHEDGGWGQRDDLPSDAYATGQALYALSLAGVKSPRAEVQRGVAFLIAGQREDGSWPMTSRAHPGARPFTNPVPITYFGSAWATLGLLRSVPN
jgi:N-acyl-D-amino-acid deacylase